MRTSFTIILPTKNRPATANYVIRETLRQTYPNFELVVLNNDDTDATERICKCFSDSRLRHVRTGGLNMIENWQRGFAEVTSDVFLFIEDKTFLREGALEYLDTVFQTTNVAFVTFPIAPTTTAENNRLPVLQRSDITLHLLQSAEIRHLALGCNLAEYHRLAPRAINTAARTHFAREVNAKCGRLFRPVAPDYTSGAQFLRAIDQYGHSSQPLTYVLTDAPSIGRSSFQKGEAADLFFKELGAPWASWLNHVPIRVPLLSNSLLNDLLGVWKDRNVDLPLLHVTDVALRDYFLLLGIDLMQKQVEGCEDSAEVALVCSALKSKSLWFRIGLVIYAFKRALSGWPNRRLRARHNLRLSVKVLCSLKILPV